MMKLNGTIAAVTGASGGIGAEAALTPVHVGARVMLGDALLASGKREWPEQRETFSALQPWSGCRVIPASRQTIRLSCLLPDQTISQSFSHCRRKVALLPEQHPVARQAGDKFGQREPGGIR